MGKKYEQINHWKNKEGCKREQTFNLFSNQRNGNESTYFFLPLRKNYWNDIGCWWEFREVSTFPVGGSINWNETVG